MTFAHTSTPIVVVSCRLAGLAIMRSLGPLGVPIYGVDADPRAPGMRSRYCRERFLLPHVEDRPEPYIEGLLAIGRRLGRRAILIPTSDETTQTIADYADVLREHFQFQDNSATLVRQLASKREMFELAVRNDVPTPQTIFPQSIDDVAAYIERGRFPVMLKGIYGNRLETRTRRKMVIVDNAAQLLEAYREMEDPDQPNLMLQEYIPGGDDQVYIFNGYFNRQSDCLVAFTGYKIRQFPVHVGCASLGECRWVEEVATTTTRFMKAIGYQGILDIGYRLDARDGRYKVLDINPRIGQAFRLFVATNDHDVAKALYLDFTGQPQPPVVRREGRRWLIEDWDLVSSYHYHREGTLTFLQWLRSFRGLEETAWFDRRDPLPALGMARTLAARAGGWLRKRVFTAIERVAAGVKSGMKRALRRAVPLSLRRRAALIIPRQRWIPEARRRWWSVELVRDLAERNVDEFHEFLWTHHLGYAESYEPESRFGDENIRQSRRMFFADLVEHLTAVGCPPRRVRSVLEVGCSLGYQLRWMETELFPDATELSGVDIDEYAIRTGTGYLRRFGSRVSLQCADVRNLAEILSGKHYDVIVCTGVLMYVTEDIAAEAVGVMLRHADVVALAGLAHPTVDNASLAGPDIRPRDNTFIHNFDGMVARHGGKVAARRWEGARDVDGNTLYFVFAVGAGSTLAARLPATARQGAVPALDAR